MLATLIIDLVQKDILITCRSYLLKNLVFKQENLPGMAITAHRNSAKAKAAGCLTFAINSRRLSAVEVGAEKQSSATSITQR